MKRLIPYLMFGLFTISLVGLMSCGGDDDGDDDPTPTLTPEQEQLAILARTWTLSTATLDNTASDAFNGLSVTFTENKAFTVSGDYEPVWPSSGTFDFGSGLFTLQRNDGVTMTISSDLSETSMTLTFNYNILPGGRTEGILGDYVFQFTAN